MNATTIEGALIVLQAERIEGVYCLLVTCRDDEAYRALPNAVAFEGRNYGLTGWNSDTNHASYQTNAKIAFARADCQECRSNRR